ncbi:hypothetical protein [Enterobacter bugandensis]|uniref:hypothetical protein n=1 Tax=Enterobacter bugandensis TaxID=881260 RepID=UPI002004383F|nr:hypothetical protein [Enterobacter bugandensis]MCK6737102.1 hypothetical protein [Enterobacter bugandensis]
MGNIAGGNKIFRAAELGLIAVTAGGCYESPSGHLFLRNEVASLRLKEKEKGASKWHKKTGILNAGLVA